MPYLDPDLVLREFSRYALEEIQPAIAEDEEFLRGQVGSMASTLRFLAGELEGIDDAVVTQRSSLLEALETARTSVGDPEVRDALAEAHDRVAEADGRPREDEGVLLRAADDALAALDTLEEDGAREARAPLYEFLDDRLATQLRLLGRPDDDG